MENKHWLALVDGFTAAPFSPKGWQDALSKLAAATGSRSAQLIGFSSGPAHFFNCVADPERDRIDDCIAYGGGSPDVNPRLLAGLTSSAMRVLTDSDVMSSSKRRRHPFYAEVLPRSGTAFFCATSLIRERNMTVGLAVLRRRREGEIQAEHKRLFGLIAYHARTAFRTHMLLEDQGALLLAGALEAASLSAFLCDSSGHVRAMTPSAEALLTEGRYLDLSHGQLATTLHHFNSTLKHHIALAGNTIPNSVRPRSSAMVVRALDGNHLVLDFMPLPRWDTMLNFEPRVLVLARGRRRPRSDTATLLKIAYALTESEAAIGMLLADGKRPEQIAKIRGSSTGTVRMQVKGIFSKLEVHSQIELVARLRPLL